MWRSRPRRARFEGGTRALGQLLAGQAGALVQKRGAIPLQETVEGVAFVAGKGLIDAGDCRCCPGHPAMMSA
jgi:hypothetical protein